jgi:hypothetical protein
MIQTLTEYLYEAVAKRSTGKYTGGRPIDSINDLDIGKRVRIKDLDELKEIKRSQLNEIQRAQRGGVILNPQMYQHAGAVVTIKRLYKDNNSVSVIENEWYWPIWALESI